MRAIRASVPSEAVLQVLTLRPHRNPVQGNNRMWLLRARPREQGLPFEARPEYTQEMRRLPRRTRSMELPVPHQEGGEGKSKSCIRRTAILPPSRGDTKKQHPIRGTGCRRPTQQTRSSPYADAAGTEHQEPIATRTRTEEDERWNHCRPSRPAEPVDTGKRQPETAEARHTYPESHGSHREQHAAVTERQQPAHGNRL